MKKAKPKLNYDPKPDMFTILCQSTLGVQCLREYRFHPTHRWRFDYAIPQWHIALEVEGGVWTRGRHVSPKGFLADMEKYNNATLMGWKLLRTTPDVLLSTKTIEMLKCAKNA